MYFWQVYCLLHFQNFTINYWIEKGADRRKLIMGLPMYGQTFSLADSTRHDMNSPTYGPGLAGEYTRAGGFLAYYEVPTVSRNLSTINSELKLTWLRLWFFRFVINSVKNHIPLFGMPREEGVHMRISATNGSASMMFLLWSKRYVCIRVELFKTGRCKPFETGVHQLRTNDRHFYIDIACPWVVNVI